MKLTSETKFFLGILGFTLLVIIGATVWFSRPAAAPAPVDKKLLVNKDSATTGNASASAYLVEFSDYQCPACKVFAPVVDNLLSKYRGRLQFVYRHYPLDQHPEAIPSAIVAEAAGRQNKFWQMHTLLFENQESLGEDKYIELGKSLKLDMEKFAADRKAPDIRKKIDGDKNDGNLLKVDSTPTFYLNGVKLTLFNPQDLVTAVENGLK